MYSSSSSSSVKPKKIYKPTPFLLSHTGEEDMWCSICDDGKEVATTYCPECVKLFCDSCIRYHKKYEKYEKNHCVKPLETLREEARTRFTLSQEIALLAPPPFHRELAFKIPLPERTGFCTKYRWGMTIHDDIIYIGNCRNDVSLYKIEENSRISPLENDTIYFPEGPEFKQVHTLLNTSRGHLITFFESSDTLCVYNHIQKEYIAVALPELVDNSYRAACIDKEDKLYIFTKNYTVFIYQLTYPEGEDVSNDVRFTLCGQFVTGVFIKNHAACVYPVYNGGRNYTCICVDPQGCVVISLGTHIAVYLPDGSLLQILPERQLSSIYVHGSFYKTQEGRDVLCLADYERECISFYNESYVYLGCYGVDGVWVPDGSIRKHEKVRRAQCTFLYKSVFYVLSSEGRDHLFTVRI